MPTPLRTLIICLLMTSGAAQAADGWHYSVGAGKIEGEATQFHMWLPQGNEPIRVAFLFVPHGSYGGYCVSDQMRDLATELHGAIVLSTKGLCGPDDDVERVFDAMQALAGKSGRPEVANLPFFVFGHSNSTRTMGDFARQVPERIVGWVAMKSAYGAQFAHPELTDIPGMVVSGELDDSYFNNQLATVKQLRREHHALVHMIVEAGGPHWPTKPTFEIQNAFLRQVFYRRVPYSADTRIAPPRLLPMKEEDGWLGQNLEGERIIDTSKPGREHKWDRPVTVKTMLAIAAFDEFPGDAATASWFPGPDYARVWQQYCATLSTDGASKVSPSLIQAWRQSRAPSADDGLESTILPDEARRLAGARTYKSSLKSLQKIVDSGEDAAAVAEAKRLIERIEAKAATALAQAQRLESTHLPTAISAYQQIEKRYDGTAAAETADERLRSKDLKQQMSEWKVLAKMRELVAAMTPVGASNINEPGFVKANGQRLSALRSMAGKLIKKSPESEAAAEAKAMLASYQMPLP